MALSDPERVTPGFVSASLAAQPNNLEAAAPEPLRYFIRMIRSMSC